MYIAITSRLQIVPPSRFHDVPDGTPSGSPHSSSLMQYSIVTRLILLWLMPLLLLAATITSGCNDAKKGSSKKNGDSSSREARSSATTDATKGSPLSAGLVMYDLKDADPESYPLHAKLREISGLAVAPDGRLFCHGDERAVVFQIDTTNGDVISRFYVGHNGVKGDFEDIAIVGTTFYLTTSSGVIYEFKEAENEQEVAPTLYQTPLAARNDVEGLCYDPATKALLLVCKGDPGKGYEGTKAVYSFSLERKSLDPKPRFLFPLNELLHLSKDEKFDPSAMALNPHTQTFFLLTSSGHALAEIDSAGRILGGASLRKSRHAQPEGLAFTRGMTLLISDEGQDGSGRLTRYPLRSHPSR